MAVKLQTSFLTPPFGFALFCMNFVLQQLRGIGLDGFPPNPPAAGGKIAPLRRGAVMAVPKTVVATVTMVVAMLNMTVATVKMTVRHP